MIKTLMTSLMLISLVSPAVCAQVEEVSFEPVRFNTGPWREGPSLDLPRAGLSAAVLNEKIFAAGGSGLIEPRDEFEVYEPEFGIWRALSALPVGLESFGMTAWRGRIWVAGGYSADTRAEPSPKVWSYDPELDAWQGEADLVGPKASLSLVVVDDTLYAIGGEDGFDGAMVYDPETISWSALPAPQSTQRRGGQAVVFNDTIWLIGGVREGVSTSSVDIYDPETGDWSRGPDLPAARAGHSVLVLDGRIHLFGGRSADMRRTLDDYWVLDGDQWRALGALPSPRTEAAGVVLNREVWLIGGGAGAGFFAPFTAVDVVDVFNPEQ